MFKPIDEKFRKCCFMDGSLLKKCHSIGGLGAGLIAVGAMLIGIGALFAVMGVVGAQSTEDEWILQMGFIVFGVMDVAAILFLAGGMALKKKRIAKYMEYFVKKSGYNREALESFERESQGPEAKYFLGTGKLQSNSALECGVSTENWLKVGVFITRMKDIAAIFYDKKPYYKGNRLDASIFVIRTDGELYHKGCKEEYAQTIIEEVAAHNPAVITMRKIMVQGEPLDCLQQHEKVAALYSQVTGR